MGFDGSVNRENPGSGSFFAEYKRLHAETCRAYIALRGVVRKEPLNSMLVEDHYLSFRDAGMRFAEEANQIIKSLSRQPMAVRETIAWFESWPMFFLLKECGRSDVLGNQSLIVRAIDRRLEYSEPDDDFGRSRL